ncbi:hypothetical protein [Micromonospora sp. KC721]|uniref:hypothetical protein n=1 Tax=Micromonospora sp. KC721 TaxID=2530380 RepID=UPI00105285B5|nr:hypothetical protein [Micromonospora sp. KC721]TDB70231.1 hypothetical protein E1182_27775 [Micromonospora sp. KC721]
MPPELTVAEPPITPATEDIRPPVPTSRRRRRRPVPMLAALVAAWLVPLAVHALHRDWLLPPLVLLATASVLRGGRTLLDRLVLALALLLGAATAGGLLFAVWPWGMRPVPLTGTALTLVVLAAAVLRRRPRLPRPGWVDLFPVAATAGMMIYLSAPWQRVHDLAGQLTILGRGEDNWRHLALFDVLGRLGGYAFVDPAAARDVLLPQMLYYPQGWHLVAALLDGFLLPAGTAPRGPEGVGHYAFWTMAGFGLLVLTLIWAAQRISGPIHLLHRFALTAVVCALLLGTQLPRLLVSGYPTEVLGLALTVLLASLVGRPLAGTREQFVLMVSLVVAIGFTYYLFLPPAAVLVLCWLLGHWREALRRWGTVALVGVAGSALALVAPLLGVLRAKQTEALAVGGGIEARTEAWRALIWLGGIVGVALLVQVRRADPAWRRWLLVCAVGVALSLGIAYYNDTSGVEPGYYFIKSTHLATALLIVGTAAVVRLLPAPRRGWSWPAVTASLAGTLGAAGVVVVAVLLCGVVGGQRSMLIASEQTWTERWVHQELHLPSKEAWVCAEAQRRYPEQPGVTTLVLDRGSYRPYLETLCLSTLHGTTAQTELGVYGMVFEEPWRTHQMVERVRGPIRFITADPNAGRRVHWILDKYPALRERVTWVPLTVPECDVLPVNLPTDTAAATEATPAVPACPSAR